MKRCPKCHYPNDDENKFCRECGTKLNKPKNYCPNCDMIFTHGEKFCVECGTKLITKSQHHKPVSINSYKVNLNNNTREDTVFISNDSPYAEFQGKTQEELETELRFVTRKYEDCRKTGDYMVNYYKEKKEILERLVGYNPF